MKKPVIINVFEKTPRDVLERAYREIQANKAKEAKKKPTA